MKNINGTFGADASGHLFGGALHGTASEQASASVNIWDDAETAFVKLAHDKSKNARHHHSYNHLAVLLNVVLLFLMLVSVPFYVAGVHVPEYSFLKLPLYLTGVVLVLFNVLTLHKKMSH